ncbi:hypothetical protein Lser_V15G19589 [Lactuca serriola]
MKRGGSGAVRTKKIPGDASNCNGNAVGGEQVQRLATDEDVQMISKETAKKVSPFIGNGRNSRFGATRYAHDAPRRVARCYSRIEDISHVRPIPFKVGKHYENQEFGRDPNRLDYFYSRPFDVFENDHLPGVGSYGGGDGGRNHGGVVAGQTTASDSAVASEGIRLRVPVGISANNDTGTVLQRLNKGKGNDGDGDGGCGGGGGGSRGVVGLRLEKERGSSETAGAGGGDRNREVPFWVFDNNGGDCGEAVVERLLRFKQDGATVTMRVAVIVVMLLMMVIMMVMVMVVLVLVIVKMEVKTVGGWWEKWRRL